MSQVLALNKVLAAPKVARRTIRRAKVVARYERIEIRRNERTIGPGFPSPSAPPLPVRPVP